MPRGTDPRRLEEARQGPETVNTHGLLAPIARVRPAAGLVPLARLMEESAAVLRAAAADELVGEDCLVARRIIETETSYRRWEREHVRIIGRIADQNHRGRQSITTLSHTFSLVHSKSLFDYLREQNVRDERRRLLITHFRGESGYARHVVQEYDTWLRATASHICLRHLGRQVLRHPAFTEPLAEYEALYREYFRCYCEWAVPTRPDTEQESLSPLLAQLKQAILAKRKELLALPAL